MGTTRRDWGSILPPVPTAAEDRQRVAEITADLLSHGLDTSPRVVAVLRRRLNDDLGTLREVAGALTPGQRCGHRSLPDPLPLVPSIVDAFAALTLSDETRDLLLVAALCTDDRLELLLPIAQRPAAEVMDDLREHLVFDRGRFTFVDARLRVWLRGTASPAEHARAHGHLHDAHSSRRDEVQADWHRARAALARTPEVAPRLVATARRLSEAGHPVWGLRLAAEAAEHAQGDVRDDARLVAGAAALSAGHVEDAAAWLGCLFRSGDAVRRAHALTGLLVAESHVHGTVPVLDPAAHRPRSDNRTLWRVWARTAGVAAVLCAERGARTATRAWLAEVRAADARAEAHGAIRDPAVALCWLLSGEREATATGMEGPISKGMVDALRAALDGDLAEALQILAREDAAFAEEGDPLIAGFERSPLVQAYRAVVEVLLLFWRGDVARARDRLLAAAVDLPVVLPFAGLGAVLARRLDLAVLGEQGVLAQALTAALPPGVRIDGLVDRGIEAYLAGAVEEAATDIRLWIDRGAPGPPLAVPGLDELGPTEPLRVVEPPDLASARALRRRIRSSPERSWRREYADIAERARALRSPFVRGRVEALLGAGCVIHGDRAAGRRHLRAARSLFADAGADAWRAAVDVRLARVGEQIEAAARPATVPITVVAGDPLAACRVAWEPLLTERELEVAMLVVDGAANRDIADRLGVSVRTVEVHVGRVKAKLDVRSRVELTALAHRTSQHL